MNGLDEDYHALVTTLSYGTHFLMFDNLRSKLIHYEQHLKFLKSRDLVGIQHSALATSVTSSESENQIRPLPPLVLLVREVTGITVAIITGKGIAIKGPAIETPISNNISLPTETCRHELHLVILFIHGIVFIIHLLLLLILLLQVTFHLKGS